MLPSSDSLQKRVIVYGPSFVGKTYAVGQLATRGYKLHYFDLDDNSETLHAIPEAGKNIDYFGLARGTPAEQVANFTLMPVQAGTFCTTHSRYQCKCTEETSFKTLWEPSKLTSRDIIVIDSASSLTQAYINSVISRGKAKLDFDDWGSIRNSMLQLVQKCKQLKSHLIIVSHEELTIYDDKASRITPIIGSRPTSQDVVKYMTDVVYATSIAGRRVFKNAPNALPFAITGTRGATIPEDAKIPLETIFPRLSPQA